jgi:hypothetical protein
MRRSLLLAVALPLLLAVGAAVVPGVALGETAGTPVTCGMTISSPGTFTLSSDLTCGADDGVISIRSQIGPVTLDLQGYTLSNTVIRIPTFTPQIPITIERGTLEAGLVTAVNTDAGGPSCAPLTLTHLTINDSPGNGVNIDGWCGLTMMGVVISNSARNGLECEGSTQTTISNSLISDNAGAGLDLNVDCGNATVTNNSVTHNGGDGIAVYSAVGAVITRNLVTWNGGGISISGESVDGPDFYLTYGVGDNTVVGNDAYGISAKLPVTDLGGNVARHNGGTPQCVNVGCVLG